MKKVFFSLVVAYNLINASPANQFEVIRKFNTIVQNISYELTSKLISSPTRLSATAPGFFVPQLREKLQEEIDAITDNKNSDELDQEEKDLVHMLEMYIAQLEMYYPDAQQ